MKNYLIATLSLFTALCAEAQSYPVSAIPDSLKENADMVVRLDEKMIEIKSPAKMIVRTHYVYTILNENELEYASYKTEYDKFTTINYVNAYLYNAGGKELEHFKKKDMKDYAAEDGVSLANDARVKTAGFSYHTYPFTVDFEEEDEVNGFMNIESWIPPRSVGVSVESSRYSIVAPKDYLVRYKLINSEINPEIEQKSDKVTYQWQLKNLKTIPDEPFPISWTAYDPFMLVAPSDVEIAGYKGNMSTWDAFGKFYGSLQKGRDVLPDNLKKKVHELTDGITGTAQKVAILYDYLQKNTHYVLVSFGIGGWQAFDASYVANNKYGDCKALSNFMVSLLKEAGIPANMVVIFGGKGARPMLKDFACNAFNHVICCVPMQKDTIWLECTSQYLPAGYLGYFTSNRYGLLVSDNGGQLVHTPAYTFSDNLQVRNISAILDENGSLKVDSKTSSRAACQDELEQFIDYHSRDEQMKTLKTSYDLPTYDINAFSYQKDYSQRLPVIRESLQLTVTDYAQVTGKRIFVNPNIISRSTLKLSEDNNRKLDIQLNETYCHIDSVQITIPPGYEPEGLSKDASLQSKFGKYETRTVIESGKIRYYRRFERYTGRFPKSEFPEVAKFFNEVYKADHAKIVLVKKS